MYLHPTIFHAKEMIANIKEFNQILLFCDFHGHSTKKDAFFYGCKTKCSNLTEQKENIYLRLFPLIFARISSHLNYKFCKFRIEKNKEATARVVVFKEFNVLASYTLETSFFGSSIEGLNSDSNIFDHEKLFHIGINFCRVICFFRTPSKLSKGVEKIYRGLISELSDSENLDIIKAIEMINPESTASIFNHEEDKQSDSDSGGSDDDDKLIEYKNAHSKSIKIIKMKPKKKIKKINPQIIKIFPKAAITCAPSSLARSASSKKINLMLNSTVNIRFRKSSFRRIKVLSTNDKNLL